MEAAVAGHRDLNRARAPGAAADDGHDAHTAVTGCTGSSRARARACGHVVLLEALVLVAAMSIAMKVLLLQATRRGR